MMIAGLLIIVELVVSLVLMLLSPRGFEDEEGFHYGDEDEIAAADVEAVYTSQEFVSWKRCDAGAARSE